MSKVENLEKLRIFSCSFNLLTLEKFENISDNQNLEYVYFFNNHFNEEEMEIFRMKKDRKLKKLKNKCIE